jgi:hypothetical protein
MEEQIENFNSTNEEEVIVPETDEPELGLPADPIEVEPKDEEVGETEVLKQRNQELYEQLKKAKGFVRDKDGKWIKKEVLQVPKEQKISEDITRTELYSLVKANVPEEDTQEVIIYAKSHGVSITEALKTPEVKALLGVRKEYRQTAEAANTGNSRRGASKLPDETIIQSASKGELPTDDEGIRRLAQLKGFRKN